MAAVPPLDELNTMPPDAFAAAVAPLFEGAPRFLHRLAEEGPFSTDSELFDAARAVARGLPEEAQVELLNAHPRIGADPASVSSLSYAEQGYDGEGHEDRAWVDDELRALNEAYESHFGFRFVIFVAGRPRIDIIPIIERALHADRDEELRRGLDDVVLIAADRHATLQGPAPLREELREAIALEISRWMIGELDRNGLIRAAHRLIDEDVRSPALLDLSLANEHEEPNLDRPVARLMSEIGLAGWDAGQAGQLLALHAAASILGEVSQPIDGARRIASVASDPRFAELVSRWEADPGARASTDEEIRRAATELFGPHDQGSWHEA
ncbi:MAG TPA: 2-oxo-4-hydroxy-4-carboxy-5-ureidoimidazoline decarboxylase [Actinomycetota bacterium]|nr:2-oxo-4-hydroxy-4-carboxy-5-ureidoimidazoline decarboxylase [Actinomycetota bacterium]